MATDTDYILVKMKLVDARRFQVEAAATAGSIKKIGAASNTAGKSMESASRRGFLLNQMMFTARRVIYAATLALGAFGAMAVTSGIMFNATMEQNTIAFTHFLGGARAAKKELDYLYKMASVTPFETTSIVSAARKFLAFGFTLKQTNAYLMVLADTAAGLALGPEGIDRMVIAFGQMQAKGRIMGDELLQLQEIGINTSQIMKEQFGLTAKQMKNIGNLNIPSSQAIPAIMEWLSRPENFGGMSKVEAKSVLGMWSTLKDNARMMFGALTMGLFEGIKKKWMPGLMKLTAAMQKGAEKGGVTGAIGALDTQLGAGGKVLRFWIDLKTTFSSIWKLLKVTLIPAVFLLNKVFQPLLLFSAFAGILKLLTRHTWLVTTAFFAWATWIAITRIVMLALWLVEKRKLLFDAIVLVTRKAITLWTMREAEATGFLATRQLLATKTSKGLLVSMLLLTKSMWNLVRGLIATGAAWLVGMGPPGWIILAVIAVIAALTTLYFKWKWFHNFVNGIFDWMKKHWKLMLLLSGNLIALQLILTIKYFGAVKSAAGQFFRWIANKFDWLANKFQSLWNKLKKLGGFIGKTASYANPTKWFATGGTMPRTGSAVVGERGPELITLPGGARVDPIRSSVTPVGAVTQVSLGIVEIPVTLKVDGRTLAETTARATLKVEARR